ncbi:MAG: carbon-nitrogen hydrolase family protein [Acidimicrobiales bacterium]|jgi:predicted amidohydrolase
MRVAAIQTTTGGDRTANLAAAAELVDEAAAVGAELVVLPEYFSVAGTPEVLRAGAEPLDGPTMTWASTTASRLRIHLVAGSFPERSRTGDGRLANTSCLVGPDGATLAVYRKIHLFDVALDGVAVKESDTFAPGDEVVVAPLPTAGAVTEAGAGVDGLRPVLGLSLCYDVRFPEIYRIMALNGATVVAVPSAFTSATGPAHWALLLRARAVEEQVFVIGAGQVGDLPAGMPRCHGHSMIVDPWGVVLAERTLSDPGVVVADLDMEYLSEVRTRLPVLANRQPGAYVGLHGSTRGTTF